MSDDEKEKIVDQPTPVEWRDYLQDHPPGSVVVVINATKDVKSQYGISTQLQSPDLQLHCPEQTCNTTMFFKSGDGGDRLEIGKWKKTYLTYWCKNCGKYWKTFSVAVCLGENHICQIYKFGELPSFGPPVPSRVLRLIQSDRELFLNGRRCENQGLGIGAFTYYRRVVESQWTRLVDQIIKIAKAINASEETLKELESLRDEKQFSKAVKSIKDGIPPALMINGHNPLVLLHGALSQGVHALTDEECLVLATSIRVVLVELAEKLGQALKDEKELNDAVSRLLQIQSKK